MRFKNNYLFLLLFLIFSISLTFIYSSVWNAEDENVRCSIGSDGKGYYNYLPALFIYDNLGKQDFESDWLVNTSSGKLNKYWVGTAVLQSPFFFAAHLVAEKQDGFSTPYQKAINISALFYVLVAMCFLFRTLILFSIKKKFATISCLLIFFATNLFYTTLYAPSMSHVYSFFAITGFLYFTALFFKENYRAKNVLLATLFFALIILIRPVNAVIFLMIPFLSDSLFSLKEKTKQLLSDYKTTTLCICLFVLMLSVQLVMWRMQTGSYILKWTYENEGFYFLHPQIAEVLFSYNNGLFVYTPLCLLALGGLIILFSQNKTKFLSVFLFLLLTIYITASWWCWGYSYNYGSRTAIDNYSVYAILFAYLLQFVSFKVRTIILSVSIFFLAISNIQAYQCYYEILNTSLLKSKSYWGLFLKTDKKYKNKIGGCNDIEPYNRFNKKLLASISTNFKNEQAIGFIDSSINYTNDKKNYFAQFNPSVERGCNTIIKVNEKFFSAHRFYLEASLSRFETEINSASDALLVVEVKDSLGITNDYYSFKINELPASSAKKWETMSYSLIMEKLKNKNSFFSIYICNKNKQTFYIDDIQLKLYAYF